MELRPLGAPLLAEESGERLDALLARQYPFLSRSGWQKKIKEQQFFVNGRTISPSYKVKTGDRFTMLHNPEIEPEVNDNIECLWRDGGMMAVFKPGNLPMHENGLYRKNTFARLVSEKFGDEWAAVHRLDKETSGIVLCAASFDLRSKLAKALANRKMEKEYFAIVHGQVAEPEWTVDAPIGDLEGSKIRIKKWINHESGLPSVTHFKVVEQKQQASLLQVKPVTGRTNQIRIHAAYVGHHLIGDKLFHPNEEVFLEYFEKRTTTPWIVEQTGFERCLLHAAALSFVHPLTQKTITIEAPIASDMQDYWRQLPE